MTFATDHDQRVRLAAFQWLRSEVDVHGEVLPRAVLAAGFTYEGVRVPLLGPQGIFKPAVLRDAPLSITTAPHGPYADSFSSGLLRYAYRGTDPSHPDNRGLRTAMAQRIPLVYLFGLVPGRYLPVWPVYIVGDSPRELFFDVAVDDPQLVATDVATQSIGEDRAAIRREYVTAVVRRRLHQRRFARGCSRRIGSDARCVVSAIRSSLTPRTSPAMRYPRASRSCRMG
jgi:putative restriction endonuclease